MSARELKRWAAAAPPGTMVPAERIAELLDDVNEAPDLLAGAVRYLPHERWAEEILGGAVKADTVAKWCRQGKIAGVRQLPDGTWIIPIDAEPPSRERAGRPLSARETGKGLVDLTRRLTSTRRIAR
jgi:hypothetical protein